MSILAQHAPRVHASAPAIVPVWALRFSAESVRDDLDLMSGLISPSLHARMADNRAQTAEALEAGDPDRCTDPDDLDPWEWPVDRKRYASADEWPDWTDAPIPYTLPPGELADYLTDRHGADHDAQADPLAVEAWTVPTAEWHDWEAMFADEPDEATREEWDRKAKARRS